MGDINHISRLPNAPLQEVVFEVRWKPVSDSTGGPPHDAGFELAQGRFADRLESDFTFQHRLMPEPVAPFLLGQLVHQFWTAEGMFPLVQFGPCIMTVNTNGQGYEWQREDGSGYRQLIRRTLEHLLASYRRNLELTEVKLFYIDAIDLPDSISAFDRFKKLNIGLQFGVDTLPSLSSARVDLGYSLAQGSTLQLSVQDATNNTSGSPALIWHIAVHKKRCDEWIGHENLAEEIIDWCDYARSFTSPLFKEMTRGKLYESFL